MVYKLKVGTVQEHFSSPLWQLSETTWGQPAFDLIWQNSGTGQMVASLNPKQEGGRKIDVAVALTEALIASIANGRNDYLLVGSYVRSPLEWAIITGTCSQAQKFQAIDDLEHVPIGISRLGSGSQTMAYYLALKRGWKKAPEFKVNDTFENLRKGVNQEPGLETGTFLWEKVTTLPYVHSGEVRFLGSIPTPWPSWSIAVSKEMLDGGEKEAALEQFLSKLQSSISNFLDKDPEQWVLERFGYKPEDAHTWFSSVRYAQDPRPNPPHSQQSSDEVTTGQNTNTSTVSSATITATIDILRRAGVVQVDPKTLDIAQYVRGKSLVA